jgi:elongator complex protein 3
MAESMIRCCAEIVKVLSEAHDEGKDVSLNAVRSKVAKKHKLKQVPRLVDIIAAVPPELADILIPKLKAKPVRTASGVGLATKFPSCTRI